jgi:2-aminoadipate transaminase
MFPQFAERMQNVRRSFVREILKAASQPEVISFAGGLPNPRFIPVNPVAAAVQDILREQGPSALQYCASEGHPALRQWIAEQYRTDGLRVDAENILILSGSQQGFDLVGKALLDPGDKIILEDPTYIAAIQSFAMFQPEFHAAPLDYDGVDIGTLRGLLAKEAVGAKIFYCMPNFQNPTGISYSADRRNRVASLLRGKPIVVLEDDPYGQLRFEGTRLPPIAAELPAQTALLGSFSKIIAPGLRLGWICAPKELIEKLLIAKQAADLHSENLGQWVIHRLVTSGEFESHLDAIRAAYRRQCHAMIDAIGRLLPSDVQFTHPEGGMFLWLTLPGDISAQALFDLAIENGVAFVPGHAFFAQGGGENTLRLNFSNCEEERIVEGITRLARAIEKIRVSRNVRRAEAKIPHSTCRS